MGSFVATSTNPRRSVVAANPSRHPHKAAPVSAVSGGPATTGALKPGDRGDAVRAVQERLALLGVMTVPVDGEFGPATHAGVITIQRQLGLPPTGEVDRQTAGAIEAAAASVTVATPTATGLPPPRAAGRRADRRQRDEQATRDHG